MVPWPRPALRYPRRCWGQRHRPSPRPSVDRPCPPLVTRRRDRRRPPHQRPRPSPHQWPPPPPRSPPPPRQRPRLQRPEQYPPPQWPPPPHWCPCQPPHSPRPPAPGWRDPPLSLVPVLVPGSVLAPVLVPGSAVAWADPAPRTAWDSWVQDPWGDRAAPAMAPATVWGTAPPPAMDGLGDRAAPMPPADFRDRGPVPSRFESA